MRPNSPLFSLLCGLSLSLALFAHVNFALALALVLAFALAFALSPTLSPTLAKVKETAKMKGARSQG